MEKQKFLMEIMDIVNGSDKTDLIKPVLELTKEAIRTQAKQGGRVYNIPTAQMYVAINGVNLIIGPGTLKKVTEALTEEGFNVGEMNGYWSIQW